MTVKLREGIESVSNVAKGLNKKSHTTPKMLQLLDSPASAHLVLIDYVLMAAASTASESAPASSRVLWEPGLLPAEERVNRELLY